MRYWDASVLVPLCVEEPRSDLARTFLRDDRTVVTWWGTHTEVVSALARRVREGTLSEAEYRQAAGRLQKLGASWAEVLPGGSVRLRAERLLRVHPLRAADALQLAAAIAWAQEPDGRAAFLTFDERLAEAAGKEGFATPGTVSIGG